MLSSSMSHKLVILIIEVLPMIYISPSSYGELVENLFCKNPEIYSRSNGTKNPHDYER